MADFKTHVLGAALVSGSAAAALEMVAPMEMSRVLGLFSLGIVGGMLPDLDSDHSLPVRITFNVLSVLGGFMPVFCYAASLSLLELVAIGVATFSLIRYVVFGVFTQLTVHRGLFHSLPAACAAGLLIAILTERCLFWSPLQAWIAASFIALGFVVHLVLDELYSVDLMGRRIRRSFGTALSLGSRSNPLGTLALYLGVFALLSVVPPPDDFLALMRDPTLREILRSRLLP